MKIKEKQLKLVKPTPHKQDVTNTCARCGLDYKDEDIAVIDGEGAVCLNCLTKKEKGKFLSF